MNWFCTHFLYKIPTWPCLHTIVARFDEICRKAQGRRKLWQRFFKNEGGCFGAKKNTISSESAHQSAKIWSRLQLCEDPFEITASKCFSEHMAPKHFTRMLKFGHKSRKLKLVFCFKSSLYDSLPHFLPCSSLLLLPNLSEIRQSENGNNVWHYHTNWVHYGCPRIFHEQLVQEKGSSFSP